MANAVVALMTGREEWEGTSSELLVALAPHAPTPTPRDWPTAANVLSGRLRRLAPHLRRVHRIHFETDRATDPTRRRLIRLRRESDGPAEPPSGSSAPSNHPGFHAARSDDPADDLQVARSTSSACRDLAAAIPEGLDGVDALSSSVPPVTAAAFAAFLNLH